MIILIGIGASIFVFLVSFWFFSRVESSPKKRSATGLQASVKSFAISSKDIENISGDDVLTTQLDLARAYIETDRKGLAKNILNNVLLHGSLDQRSEAQQLMATFQTT